eukprot:12899184-Prorocentrum_lima.AAC.1
MRLATSSCAALLAAAAARQAVGGFTAPLATSAIRVFLHHSPRDRLRGEGVKHATPLGGIGYVELCLL